MMDAESITIAIQVAKLADLAAAGQAGHWDGLYAAKGLSPEQLLGLRAYFSSALAAVQEALDRHKVAEAERFRAELRAEAQRPKRGAPRSQGSALDQLLEEML